MKTRIPLLDAHSRSKLHSHKERPVIVIGDLMLDSYTEGTVNKISVESPVPILLNPSIANYYIGGAGNVAHNLKTLGNEVILIAGLGARDGKVDSSGLILSDLLNEAQISTKYLLPLERRTTVKKRIIGNKQQLLRIDEEDTFPLTSAEEKSVLTLLTDAVKSSSAIIVSDYAKGFITGKVADEIQQLADKHKIPLIIDFKPQTASKFKKARLIKSNLKEAQDIAGFQCSDLKDIEKLAKEMSRRFSSEIVITCSNRGIVCLTYNGEYIHISGKAKEVFDVTGAGDTVTAALAHGFIRDLPLDDSCIFSMVAANVAISKKGIVSVNMHEIDAEISKIIMPKTWGHEEWIVNADYCGKKLVLNEGHCCSLHYHKIKDETFYIASGRVGFQLNDQYFILNPGDSLLISPGTKHRFYGLEHSEIFEFSTHHLEEDSYRDEVSGTFEKSFFDSVPNYNSRNAKN